MIMRMKAHDPSAIFAAVGPYAHGLEVVGGQRLLFISGTMGLDRTGKAPEGIDEQCAQAWRNITAILEDAGMTVRNLVKVGGPSRGDHGHRIDATGGWLAGGDRGHRRCIVA